MGGWTLWNGWFIKSSYMAMNELYACQLTETKVQKKRKKKKKKISQILFIARAKSVGYVLPSFLLRKERAAIHFESFCVL